MAKQKEFQVGHTIKIWADTTIKAATFEDAIATAKALKLDDLVDVYGEVQDSRVEVIQVFDGETLDF